MTGFAQAGQALASAGLHGPVLVLDHDALAANIATLRRDLPRGYALRIADKSLPAPDLLAAAMAGLATDRIMSFHLPLTARVLDRFAHAGVLMGKPAPVAMAADFLRGHARAGQVTWLIDSPRRAADYAALARDLGRDLPVAFEVDIGLGRGGFTDPGDLAASCLPGLTPRGLMGYEAHTAALPALLGRGTRAQNAAMARLASFRQAVAEQACGNAGDLVVNTGGSSTALALPPDGPGTELTLGSALVKPSDFDQPCNAALRPALFIATPVLKCVPHGLPGHPRLSRWLRHLRLIGGRIAFVYGGKWMAHPVWPQGLTGSPFYGESANQQGFVLPRGTPPPDRIWLRPTQSEALIQQFPALHVLQGGQITDRWPVWPPA